MSKIDPSKPKSELEADHATGHRHGRVIRLGNAKNHLILRVILLTERQQVLEQAGLVPV